MSNSNLPQWKCHKVVRAAKIIDWSRPPATDAPYAVTLEGVPGVFTINAARIPNDAAIVGGYLVDYEDGYTSFSPAEAFESGYTRLPDGIDKLPGHQSRVVMEEAELAPRYERLTAFCNGEVFKALPEEERSDLLEQQVAMSVYLNALRSRISRFKAGAQ